MLGGSPAEDAQSAPEIATAWLTQKVWASLLTFSQLFEKKDFAKQFITDIEQWEAYYNDSNALWDSKVPAKMKPMGPFEKLVIIRLLKPEKFIEGCQNMIVEVLGKSYI